MMSHPLALAEDDDDDFQSVVSGSANLRVVESSSLSSSTSSSERRSNKAASEESIDAQTAALANLIRSKCVEKRQAPKAPSLSPLAPPVPPPPTLPRLSLLAPVVTPTPSPRHDINRTSPVLNDEFLIPVEHVRWFYKTEKEKHLHHSAETLAANNNKTTPNPETNTNPTFDPNNNNTVDSKLIVVRFFSLSFFSLLTQRSC